MPQMEIGMAGFFKYTLILILHAFLIMYIHSFLAIFISVFLAYIVTKSNEKEKLVITINLIISMSIYLLSLNFELLAISLVPLFFIFDNNL